MKNLIKYCLSLSDYLTERKIINQLKRVFLNKKTISVIDVGAHKGENISDIIKNFITHFNEALIKRLLNYYTC